MGSLLPAGAVRATARADTQSPLWHPEPAERSCAAGEATQMAFSYRLSVRSPTRVKLFRERLFRCHREAACSLPCRPRYLSARECRGDSRTVLGRERATLPSLRLPPASIVISGFSGVTIPVIIRCGIHRRPSIRFRLSIALRVLICRNKDTIRRE